MASGRLVAGYAGRVRCDSHEGLCYGSSTTTPMRSGEALAPSSERCSPHSRARSLMADVMADEMANEMAGVMAGGMAGRL